MNKDTRGTIEFCENRLKETYYTNEATRVR